MVPAAAINLRHGGAKLGRDGGMVRALIEQKNGRRLAILRHDYSSSPVQRGSARPMIALAGNAPKYRPSSEVRRLPVHEEDFAVGDDVAALPDGQRATAAVTLARHTHLRSCRR